ncbi:PTS mannitol transporter subunit IICB [Bacillus sp. OTU530]|uniref:PTS mannitol transporter subunit IICB n=1 Tax=Bacillus sp. OTU530 TaxID=3043862 RepID=UPI00313B1ED5
MRKLGQLLSAMIWQNIAVIISVGMIREVFGVYGWWYNERILLLVDPIYNTLLPILLGYTGGKLIGGQRGAVVASFVIYGLTLSSSAPVIFAAMVIGPLIGWMIRKCDQTIKGRIPVGYELLINNVLASLIGVSFTVVCFLYVGQTLSAGVEWSTKYLEEIIYSGWLPLAAVIIEPAKVFFLNNIVNYGILAPLGIQQTKELGKSIFFLLESNPGPGLGILLAYWLKSAGEKRRGAQLALFIQFFGGIHEVYFSYVLRRPMLILGLMLGGMTGIIIFQMFDVGTVSLPSPGSIFLFLALAPKEDMVFVFMGVFLSAAVTFLCSMLILKPFTESPTEQENREQVTFMNKLETIENLNEEEVAIHQTINTGEPDYIVCDPGAINYTSSIEKIVFVCEVGLGSSAMGAAMLRRKLEQANLQIEVDNSSVDEIPQDTDLIICHQKLVADVEKYAPNKIYYPLQSFTDIDAYDTLIDKLKLQ